MDETPVERKAKEVPEEASSGHAGGLGGSHDHGRAKPMTQKTMAIAPPTMLPLLPKTRQAGKQEKPSSGITMRPEPVETMYAGRWPVVEVSIKKSGQGTDPTIPHPAKDHLLSVHQLGDTYVALRFLDGFVGTLNLTDLGLNIPSLRLGTIRAAEWGGAAEVEDQKWHTVHIDASVLRAHVDPEYAAVLQEAIDELM